MAISNSPSRALVLAPYGRDGAIACELLASAKINSVICKDLLELESQLGEDASLAVVDEDALRHGYLQGVKARLAAQPSWSDIPFIILTRRAPALDQGRESMLLHDIISNVTLLERPFHPATFVSVARTALKGRQRQYEARARMEQLHEGEERLRTALLAGRLGAFELNFQNWTLMTSATCRTLLGRAVDEPFAYDDLLQAIHADDRSNVLAAIDGAARSGGDLVEEFRVPWRDGSTHCVEIRARAVRDRSAANPRLVGVLSDVTDRKARQDALTRMNEILEERVAARTAELTASHAAVLAEMEQRKRAEEQLRQVQKMETIGQLTGNVAHDFNNLLTAVIGNLELLRKRVANDPRAVRLVDGACQGAQRGAALTQRLLAFARRQDLKVEPRSLTDLVSGAVDLIERSIGSRIELRLHLSQDSPPALVDANQIELALLNLVVNARDAMPNGGVVSISVDHPQAAPGAGLPEGPYVRLTVSDTGYGMDAETLEKATEPFFSTKEQGKGTGLGLSMVHGLAVQLNGALRLSSEVGAGTRAELWLPATTPLVGEEKRAPISVGREMEELNVLVVDDDFLVAFSTVEMLRDLGHRVVESSSGEDALEIIRNDSTVDIMVTDFSMPRMNGAQLASAARRLRPDLPILLASGYAELPSDSIRDLPRIAKPYQQEQLAAEIVKVWKRATGRDQAL